MRLFQNKSRSLQELASGLEFKNKDYQPGLLGNPAELAAAILLAYLDRTAIETEYPSLGKNFGLDGPGVKFLIEWLSAIYDHKDFGSLPYSNRPAARTLRRLAKKVVAQRGRKKLRVSSKHRWGNVLCDGEDHWHDGKSGIQFAESYNPPCRYNRA